MIADLNGRLEAGVVELTFNGPSGYLASLLDVLDVPAESQVLVFSPTSFQEEFIRFDNPRAVFFGDNIAIGWVRGAEVLEIAAQDRQQGTIFYSLPQSETAAPRFERRENCLACHLSWDTLGVPGLQVLSMFPMPKDRNAYASGHTTDHRSRLQDRWGGWYVTGSHGGVAHMGNVPVVDVNDPQATFGLIPDVINSVDGKFDLEGYPSAHSDIVALMVLEHQARMHNLITQAHFETDTVDHYDRLYNKALDRPRGYRSKVSKRRIARVAGDLLRYMLFIDEFTLKSPVRGTSKFAEEFSSRGRLDKLGRSLRQLDLRRRLFRHPCSFLVESPSFAQLPVSVRTLVADRLRSVLEDKTPGEDYARLSSDDRKTIREILDANRPSWWVTVAKNSRSKK